MWMWFGAFPGAFGLGSRQPGPAVLPGALVRAGLGPGSSSAALQANPAGVGGTVGALRHSANFSGVPAPCLL